MPSNLTLSLLQQVPTPDAVATSLARIEQNAAIASAAGSDLLLVPEASLTGYNIPLSRAQAVAETCDGAAANRIADICQQHDIGIAYGFIERDGNSLYNTVQLLDKSGTPLGHYRKTHLWGDLDQTLFQAGEQFAPLIDFYGWQIGCLICYDIEFPENTRHLALAGADLILTPTALMSPWSFVADHMIKVRAAENQVFIAYANYCGGENGLDYVGHSGIVGPDGDDLARAESRPILLSAVLEHKAISNIREQLPYHRDRRPGLYTAVSRS